MPLRRTLTGRVERYKLKIQRRQKKAKELQEAGVSLYPYHTKRFRIKGNTTISNSDMSTEHIKMEHATDDVDNIDCLCVIKTEKEVIQQTYSPVDYSWSSSPRLLDIDNTPMSSRSTSRDVKVFETTKNEPQENINTNSTKYSKRNQKCCNYILEEKCAIKNEDIKSEMM